MKKNYTSPATYFHKLAPQNLLSATIIENKTKSLDSNYYETDLADEFG